MIGYRWIWQLVKMKRVRGFYEFSREKSIFQLRASFIVVMEDFRKFKQHENCIKKHEEHDSL